MQYRMQYWLTCPQCEHQMEVGKHERCWRFGWPLPVDLSEDMGRASIGRFDRR